MAVTTTTSQHCNNVLYSLNYCLNIFFLLTVQNFHLSKKRFGVVPQLCDLHKQHASMYCPARCSVQKAPRTSTSSWGSQSARATAVPRSTTHRARAPTVATHKRHFRQVIQRTHAHGARARTRGQAFVRVYMYARVHAQSDARMHRPMCTLAYDTRTCTHRYA